MEQPLTVRRSPVELPGQAEETDHYDGFSIVRSFLREGGGPYLVDLSHLAKWDLQDRALREMDAAGARIPEKPGQSLVTDGILVNRLNATQVSLWDLGATGLDLSGQPAATDVTDGTCLLALLGAKVFAAMERLTSLDLGVKGRTTPYVLQGPVAHIACQVVVLNATGHRAVLLAFSRGYGQAVAETILAAGSRLGLRPAGFKRFQQMMQQVC